MFRTLTLSALLLAASAANAGTPEERNTTLDDRYHSSITSVCAQSTTPFGAGGQATSSVTPITRTLELVRSYNGDGTTTAVGRSFQLTGLNTAGGFPISEATINCTGTYQVHPDFTFTETQTCSGNVLSGPSAGLTYTTSPSTVTGRIQSTLLLLTDTFANPTTLTLSNGQVFHRMCSASGTAVKVLE